MVYGHEPNKGKQRLKESKGGAEIGTHINNYESMIFATQKFNEHHTKKIYKIASLSIFSFIHSPHTPPPPQRIYA